MDSHCNKSRVGIRWSDQLHQIFLWGKWEPAYIPTWTARSTWSQIGSLHAIVLRYKWWAWITRWAAASQVRRGVDPRAVEPKVRVWRRGGVVAQFVWGRSRALRTRQRRRRVVAFTIHAELWRFLAQTRKLWATTRRWLVLSLEWRHCQVSFHLSPSSNRFFCCPSSLPQTPDVFSVPENLSFSVLNKILTARSNNCLLFSKWLTALLKIFVGLSLLYAKVSPVPLAISSCLVRPLCILIGSFLRWEAYAFLFSFFLSSANSVPSGGFVHSLLIFHSVW